jgi:hypothetical protein
MNKMDPAVSIAVKEPVFRRLRLYNAFMGFLHLIQGVMMIVLSNAFSLPVQSPSLSFTIAGKVLSAPATDWFALRIGPFVAVFLFLSALAHFLLTLPGVFPWYVRNLQRKINYIRWWEYAFSSSIMILIIAMLNGIYDFPSLLMMFSLNALMNFWGLMMEVHNQTTKQTNWMAYLFGCFAGIIPWVVIVVYLLTARNSLGAPIPNFVYWILVSIFVFFNIFAINMVLQYKKVGRWKDYLYGERVYILLSLVAKSLLAWQIFAGTLRPQ